MNVRRVLVILLITGLVQAAFLPTSHAASSPTIFLRDLQLTSSADDLQAAGTVKCPSVYVVRYSETLASIAARCGVSTTALIQANGLRTLRLWPGQRLYIPSGSSSAVPRSTPSVHPPLVP